MRQRHGSLFHTFRALFFFPRRPKTPNFPLLQEDFHHPFMDYFKIIPKEITLDILTRLPAELVLDCKLVCTNWKNLVSYNPLFSKMHLHRLNHPSDSAASDSGKLKGFISFTVGGKFHYFENHDQSTTPIQRIIRFNFAPPYKYLRFVGSCNGLICLADNLCYSDVWICNPITREYVRLPQIPIYPMGFGYVSSTNQYKVVGIHKLEINVEVHIYTLGSGSGWRNLGEFNFESRSYSKWRHGTFVDGALYWLNSKLETIVAFDLDEEQFHEHISPPPLPPYRDWFDTILGVLDGFLFFGINHFVQSVMTGDIWLLKKNTGEEHQSLGWSKQFRITDIGQLFAITKSNRVLTYGHKNLSIYDTRISTSKTLVKFKTTVLQVSPHQNTLVSLKELGEEDTNVMASVETEETRGRDYSFEQLQEDANPENI